MVVVVVGCGWGSEDAEQVGAVMAAGRGIHSGSHSVVIFVLLHGISQWVCLFPQWRCVSAGKVEKTSRVGYCRESPSGL